MLVPIPDGIDPKTVASAGDNIADAWRTVAPHLAAYPGARVLITGRRSVGLYAVAIAVLLGASRVDYLDTDESRCALAERLGASPVRAELGEKAGSYDITVDTTYSPAGLRTALSSLGRGGVCTCVYPAFEDVTLSPLELWMRGIRLQIGGANYRAHLPDVLDLVASGQLHPEVITSEEIPWDEAHERLLSPSLKPLVVRG
jgi:alcohol dehydrogenase